MLSCYSLGRTEKTPSTLTSTKARSTDLLNVMKYISIEMTDVRPRSNQEINFCLYSSRLLPKSLKIKIGLCKTTILPVLYDCETLSVTLREEHRWRVFENRVLRRIFGPKRKDITESWRKLHIEELHNFHSSPNFIR
jgi:hypothetical protein